MALKSSQCLLVSSGPEKNMKLKYFRYRLYHSTYQVLVNLLICPTICYTLLFTLYLYELTYQICSSGSTLAGWSGKLLLTFKTHRGPHLFGEVFLDETFGPTVCRQNQTFPHRHFPAPWGFLWSANHVVLELCVYKISLPLDCGVLKSNDLIFLSFLSVSVESRCCINIIE